MPIAQDTQKRFEECIDACADALFRVAFRLTGDQTLASDLVQETYLNAWRNLDSLVDPDRIRGWMFSILRNQYSKLIRREARAVSSAENLEQIAGTEDTEDIVSDQTTDVVQAALGQLDDKHKLPLLLVAMEGISVDEASTILELPRGTVLSRLHRGRQKLKAILKRSPIRLTRTRDHDEF